MIISEHLYSNDHDCTETSRLTFDKPYTVDRFIKHILGGDGHGWGTMTVETDKDTYRCKYENNELTTPPMPDNILDKQIKHVIATGGYSMYNYNIKI